MTVSEVEKLTNFQLLKGLGFPRKRVGNSTMGLHEAMQKMESYPEAHPRALMVCEFAKRWNQKPENPPMVFSNPMMVFLHFRDRVIDAEQEHFFALLLNVKQELIAEVLVAKGTLGHCSYHPRDVFRPAYEKSAFSIVVAHNHPTNRVAPSQDDINGTNRLVEAGEVAGIPVVDHVIFSAENYFSFSQYHLM